MLALLPASASSDAISFSIASNAALALSTTAFSGLSASARASSTFSASAAKKGSYCLFFSFDQKPSLLLRSLVTRFVRPSARVFIASVAVAVALASRSSSAPMRVSKSCSFCTDLASAALPVCGLSLSSSSRSAAALAASS